MKQNKSIEQLYRTAFEEIEEFGVSPSPKVWKGVRKDLFVRNFLRFSPYSVNVWYAAGVLIVGAALVLRVFFDGGVEKEFKMQNANGKMQGAKEEEFKMQNANGKIQNADFSEQLDSVKSTRLSNIDVLAADKAANEDHTPVSRLRTSDSFSGTPNNKDLATSKAIIEDHTPVSRPQTSDSFLRTPNTEVLAADKATNEDHTPVSGLRTSDLSILEPSVLAFFQCSERNGCAPLLTEFRNFSQNAIRYSWSFGDGGSSEMANPTYIFDEAGTWFVSLTAYSANNEISVFTDSIQVHALPEARFSMDVQGMPGSAQPVYFYNYSREADSYLWDFGDGASSTAKEPDHYFAKKVKTDIKLLALSSAGCADSTILKDAFKTGEPVLIFPTAFSPNTNGPGTGLYTLKNPENDVFYPFAEEEPIEYQLRIFNRSGILIFESSDIHIGWDGYFKQELQPQGVYVWKARAKFADGRSVVRLGDVTLLWKD
jgi:PKD repeat protein